MKSSREHQQRTSRTPLGFRHRVGFAIAAPVLRLLCRLLLRSYRLRAVHGSHHLGPLIEAGQSTLLCCWHQRLVYTVGWALGQRGRGLQPGFLVSPSRDGELIAAVVGGLGVSVLRGSANRTGARAFRDMFATLKSGVSPIVAVDGPHGPAFEVKSGTPMLAQMTGTPLLPVSFAADRYWQLGSWDKTIIPKPFARISVQIGEPIMCTRGDDPGTQATTLATQLHTLDKAAARALKSR